MCFEQIIGFSTLALLLVGYIFSRLTRKVNWAMLGYCLRHMLNAW